MHTDIMKIFKILFVATFLFLVPFNIKAQFVKSGDIRAYASAILNSQLSPDLADKYGITPSASRVLLHVVVRQGEPGKDRSLPAKITATGVRKNGERNDINMQLTKENDEVYYLGELNISGNEAVNFEIVIDIENQKPMRMSFFKEFFSQ
jgi:Domain of unknown function (DUF4426)